MPTAPPTLDDLKATEAAATTARIAAEKRIDDARAEVRAAALAHYQTVMASLQPQPPAKPAKAKTTATAAPVVPDLTALQERVRKALDTYQTVCRDLGV